MKHDCRGRRSVFIYLVRSSAVGCGLRSTGPGCQGSEHLATWLGQSSRDASQSTVLSRDEFDIGLPRRTDNGGGPTCRRASHTAARRKVSRAVAAVLWPGCWSLHDDTLSVCLVLQCMRRVIFTLAKFLFYAHSATKSKTVL